MDGNRFPNGFHPPTVRGMFRRFPMNDVCNPSLDLAIGMVTRIGEIGARGRFASAGDPCGRATPFAASATTGACLAGWVAEVSGAGGATKEH